MTRSAMPPPAPVTAVHRVAQLADALEQRLRRHGPLFELFRAHGAMQGEGPSWSVAEQGLGLVELGVRWRDEAWRTRRDPRAEPGPGELDAMIALLAAEGGREPELRRLRTWRDFVEAERVPEALSDAIDLAVWFDEVSRLTFGQDVPALADRIALVRGELVARALRAQRLGAAAGPRSEPRAGATARG